MAPGRIYHALQLSALNTLPCLSPHLQLLCGLSALQLYSFIALHTTITFEVHAIEFNMEPESRRIRKKLLDSLRGRQLPIPDLERFFEHWPQYVNPNLERLRIDVDEKLRRYVVTLPILKLLLLTIWGKSFSRR